MKTNKYSNMVVAIRASKKKELKRKVRLGIAFISTIFVLVMICMGIISSGKNCVDFVSVTVQPGDTIWSLAKQNCEGSDIRECVYEIKQVNNIDDNLNVGDTVRIPQ